MKRIKTAAFVRDDTHHPRFSQHHTALFKEQLSGVPAVFCGSQAALQTIAKAFRVL